MQTRILNTNKAKIFVKSIYLFLTLFLIYLVPTFSHLIGFPLYLIEPMRFILILSIVFFDKRMTYLMALTMPIFSFLISSHPVFLKVLLISIELFLNVYMYYLLFDLTKKTFLSALISIISSKIIYYALKYLLIVGLVFSSSLVSTPILMQVATTIVFSFIIFLVPQLINYRKSNSK